MEKIKLLSIQKDFFKNKENPITNSKDFQEAIKECKFMEQDDEHVNVGVGVTLRDTKGNIIVFNPYGTIADVLSIGTNLTPTNMLMSDEFDEDMLTFFAFITLRDSLMNFFNEKEECDSPSETFKKLSNYMLQSQLNCLGLFHYKTDGVPPLFVIEVVLLGELFLNMTSELGLISTNIKMLKDGRQQSSVPKSILECMKYE